MSSDELRSESAIRQREGIYDLFESRSSTAHDADKPEKNWQSSKNLNFN